MIINRSFWYLKDTRPRQSRTLNTKITNVNNHLLELIFYNETSAWINLIIEKKDPSEHKPERSGPLT